MSKTAFAWQSDLFLGIALYHKTGSSTGGTIAAANCR